jgi:hypothetical protein
MILIWFDDATGEPHMVGMTKQGEPEATLNVEFFTCSKMLDNLGNAYMAAYTTIKGEPNGISEWVLKSAKEAGKGTVVDFGPERGTVEITANDVGILFVIDPQGYPVLDIGLAKQPTAAQMWAAAAACDELARFNLRGKLVVNDQQRQGPNAVPRPKIHVAGKGTRMPKPPGGGNN